MLKRMSRADVVREAFAGQARAFEDKDRHFGAEDVVAWLAGNTPVASGDVVLEAAAGTGIFSRSIAGSVASVVAVDLTPEMLAEGKLVADKLGITNVIWQEGDVTALPFLPNTFDRVLSRLAIHHFEDPSVPIAEMVRVCRPGGTITIVDMVVLDHHDQQVFNDLERLRDPSHTRALTRAGLRDAIESAGCVVTHRATRVNILNGQRWLDQTSTPPNQAAFILDAWRVEMDGGATTGMLPSLGASGIEFAHHWDLLVATVPF
jgi:ubiquinone/menaquinone biosynthesis C-methylase UbiE